MTLYALQDIDDAIDATRSFLWPFDLGRWLKLAVVVFFIGGSGGSSVNPGQFSNTASTDSPPMDPGTMPSLSEITNALGTTEWLLVAGAVALIVLLVLVLSFVSAVMEFVFVESLSRERVAIREYWRGWWRAGGRLFGFRLVVGLLSLTVAGGAILAALWPLLEGGGGFSVAALLLAIGVALVVTLVSSLVNGFTTQFVVPVMITGNLTVLGAWRRFWPTMVGQWKQYLAYVFLRLVLSIAVAVVVGVVSALGALVLAIPFGVLALLGAAVLTVSQVAGWAVILLAGALFVVTLLVLSLFVSVPVQTFLRYYALLVLGDTEAAFDLVDEQRQAIRA